MEMRSRAPVTRGYFFLLGALRLVNAASPRNIDQKKISSGTQGILPQVNDTIALIQFDYALSSISDELRTASRSTLLLKPNYPWMTSTHCFPYTVIMTSLSSVNISINVERGNKNKVLKMSANTVWLDEASGL